MGAKKMKFLEFAAMLNADIWGPEDHMPLYSVFIWNGSSEYACWINDIFQDWPGPE